MTVNWSTFSHEKVIGRQMRWASTPYSYFNITKNYLVLKRAALTAIEDASNRFPPHSSNCDWKTEYSIMHTITVNSCVAPVLVEFSWTELDYSHCCTADKKTLIMMKIKRGIICVIVWYTVVIPSSMPLWRQLLPSVS